MQTMYACYWQSLIKFQLESYLTFLHIYFVNLIRFIFCEDSTGKSNFIF